ncbi:Spy/CpxP family protein refolding chaperone [Marinifilum fragile]|uniref:Spy/CpxP family protein refolding chaperone n=1 Tax=Marinifilum fragile TaxID=570161 RepID=UPI0006CFD349|nr:periplasmic heavy metal sensor [Marinifilum fragile]
MNRSRKIWMWLALILLATNLSTIGSFWYHTYQEKKEVVKPEMPVEYRIRFLKDQLGLNEEQKNYFKSLNRDYNRNANQIMLSLNALRQEMLENLGEETCDSVRMKEIANEIGEKHEELKLATVQFYLDMKGELNKEQQTKLYDLFSSLIQKSEEVKTPRGKRKGRGEGKGHGPWH